MQSDETAVSARTHVSIRIFAPHLLPEDVTKNLQILPDHAHHQGDYPRNNPKYSAYKHGMWILNSKKIEDQPLEAHLDSLITILEPNSSYLRRLAQEATIDVYCVLYSQSGFQLSPQILKRLGDLGVTFGAVLYNDDASHQRGEEDQS